MTSGESVAERAELVAIQVALARGYLQQQDLREAVSMHQRLQLEGGERRGLLSVLGEGYLRPEHLPELRAIYEQALKAGGSDRLNRTRADPPSDRGVIHDAPTRGPRHGSSSGSHTALPGCVGRYELLGELGRGGMGVVYRAHDPALGRDVALKVLAADATAAEERARFAREAHAAGSLRHPHVVRVLDVGLDHDPPYLVMDLIEGESLKARVARAGPLEPRAAATLVRKLVGALTAAHDRGLVHRDVKPGNVLLDAAGEPYLTDFGLVRRADEQRLTRSGDVVGTPHYMSPEQARGDKEIDGRTDLWSIGAVLYQLLVGQPPLKEVSLIEHMKALLNRDPEPPSKARPGLPPELDAIVMRCLVRDLSARYADARQLAADLDAFLEGGPPRPAQPGPATSTAPVLAVLVLCAGVAATLGIMLLRESGAGAKPPDPAPPPASSPAPNEQALAIARAAELRQRASRLRDQGSLPEAIALLGEALVVVPGDLETLRLRAELHAANGDRASALADLGLALERDPGSVPCRSLRAELRLQDDLDLALDDLEKLGSRAEQALRSKVAEALADRADALLATNGDRARADAQRVLVLEPGHPYAQSVLVQALLQLGRFDEVKAVADEALAHPERLRAVGTLANVRWARAQAHGQLGAPRAAVADLEQALPELAASFQGVATYQLARYHLQAGNPAAAEEYAQRALTRLSDSRYRQLTEEVLRAARRQLERR